MPTDVSAVMLRDFGEETFAALDAITGGATFTATPANGVTTLTFDTPDDAPLTEEQQAAVIDLMTSRSEDDRLRRAALVDALAAMAAMTGLNNNGTAAAYPIKLKVDAMADVLTTLAAFVLGRSDT